jgi:hypothetical protein
MLATDSDSAPPSGLGSNNRSLVLDLSLTQDLLVAVTRKLSVASLAARRGGHERRRWATYALPDETLPKARSLQSFPS